MLEYFVLLDLIIFWLRGTKNVIGAPIKCEEEGHRPDVNGICRLIFGQTRNKGNYRREEIEGNRRNDESELNEFSVTPMEFSNGQR